MRRQRNDDDDDENTVTSDTAALQLHAALDKTNASQIINYFIFEIKVLSGGGDNVVRFDIDFGSARRKESRYLYQRLHRIVRTHTNARSRATLAKMF